mmetsp:Transcript_707/g.1238  ORF Transcript_707/g.1238 Transcript_707/m.1238 type:complete len:328 (+) Transcript_707:131-1114(+)|eukprot:CAMPEP_0176491638 /NCGR_PEP_ID=MMETSP0200_2-20121128/8541_1 /TAXON_ID=947934 /ORGANISM="Chaetoceros sp., Strain GSL56" /LENGTH=327 /DNA_ID=CAMNT_0017889085 /DNA_START=101 /DNA_END=1084 /DNA_ORIENTATION=+
MTIRSVHSLLGRKALSYLGKSRSDASSSNRLHLFSFSTQVNDDPSTLVAGVTADDLEKKSAMANYFAANFPEYRSAGFSSSEISGISREDQSSDDDIDTHEDSQVGQKIESPLNIRYLSCYKRTEEGSRMCVRLREYYNLIPGVIYGSDSTQNILSIDPSSRILVKTPWEQIQREMDLFTYHNFESRVYNLTVYEDESDDEGVVHRVVPANVKHHPVLHKIYCCNFLRYFPGKPIKIPLVYINEEESGALKRGGFVVPLNRHVTCIVDEGVRIPDAIEVDCTNLNLKDVIRMDRLIFPDGVRAGKKQYKDRFLVGTVFGRRSDTADS